jgi:hypothetical protein
LISEADSDLRPAVIAAAVMATTMVRRFGVNLANECKNTKNSQNRN